MGGLKLLGPNGSDAVTLQNTTNVTKSVDVTDIASDSFVKGRVGTGGGLSFRNKIVDGRFDFWYEGTTQTYTNRSGYGAETMVFNTTNNDTLLVSQQDIALGEIDVPTALYWSKNVVASTGYSDSFSVKKFKIEGVRSLAGKTVTFSFYAKVDSAKPVAIEFVQSFGSGGSSDVTGIGAQQVALSTKAARYFVTVDLPSISGKTIGAGDKLEINIWMSAEKGNAGRAANLAQSSGTFYFTCLQLEEGPVMTSFEELPMEVSQMRVNRYFEYLFIICREYSGGGQSVSTSVYYKTIKRAQPAVAAHGGAITYSNCSEPAAAFSNNLTMTEMVSTATTSGTVYFYGYIKADARL